MRELCQLIRGKIHFHVARGFVFGATPLGTPLRGTLSGRRSSAARISLLKRYEDGSVRKVILRCLEYGQFCLLTC